MIFGEDIGGWLWLLMNVVFVAVLGAAIAYGMRQWRKRRGDRRLDAARDAEVRRQYEREP